MPKFLQKLPGPADLVDKFMETCANIFLYEIIQLQKRKLVRVNLVEKAPQKPFFDCGGQGCRIISAK
jgi:hypothetical protein